MITNLSKATQDRIIRGLIHQEIVKREIVDIAQKQTVRFAHCSVGSAFAG